MARISVGASNRYNSNSRLQSQTSGLFVPTNYSFENSIGVVATTNLLAQRKVNSAFGYLDVDYKKMVYLSVQEEMTGPLLYKNQTIPISILLLHWVLFHQLCSSFRNLFLLQSSEGRGPGYLLTI